MAAQVKFLHAQRVPQRCRNCLIIPIDLSPREE
jgi:hypothetical protein